ncbi:hypothetical protein [Caballeronia sp. LZ034LL]|uniref:hypothetical protein n=1 Tax=Caballeronia sp. LZ034LL TaxID=3038567 RepID=UPI002857040D|nr:hypothetical protein [Caballeronia sp. LZ034LL]MDR5835373.1 hypothetical protein [Caballeronia sp. LZ034LL]
MLSDLPNLLPPYKLHGKYYWAVGDQTELWDALRRFTRSTLKTDHLPFSITKSGAPIKTAWESEEYDHLANFFLVFDIWMDLYQPGCRYSPDVELFFSYVATSKIGEIRRVTALGKNNIDDATRQAPLYNELIQAIRFKAREGRLSRKLATLRATVPEQERSIECYLRALSSRYKVLRFNRLDHFYEKSPFDVADGLERLPWGGKSREIIRQNNFNENWIDQPETRGRIDVKTIIGHRNAFFGTRDREEAYLGYLSKVERGGSHGAFHMHTLLIYDGSRVRDNQLEALADLDARLWGEITGGTGLSYNCKSRRDIGYLMQTNRWALDPLNEGDELALTRLVEYCRYFSDDKGQMPLVKPSQKSNLMTKGHFPKR